MVNSAIHEDKDLEFNSLANCQPVKAEQNRCDVISSAGPSSESRRRILDHLQLMHQASAHRRVELCRS